MELGVLAVGFALVNQIVKGADVAAIFATWIKHHVVGPATLSTYPWERITGWPQGGGSWGFWVASKDSAGK